MGTVLEVPRIAKKFGDLNRDLISAAQAARIATVRQLHPEIPNSELITMSDDYDANMMTEELEYNYNMMMIRRQYEYFMVQIMEGR